MIPALLGRIVVSGAHTGPSPHGDARGQAFADALSDVAGVARDMAVERTAIASQMRRVIASGDNSRMPEVVSRILDANARQDVMATVLTKTTTGIDQLVKMQ